MRIAQTLRRQQALHIRLHERRHDEDVAHELDRRRDNNVDHLNNLKNNRQRKSKLNLYRVFFSLNMMHHDRIQHGLRFHAAID